MTRTERLRRIARRVPFFGDVVSVVLSSSDFSGRAPRREFWSWFLFIIIAFVLADKLSYALSSDWTLPCYAVAILLLAPTASVFLRRLRDANRITPSLVCLLLSVFAWLARSIAWDILKAHKEPEYDYLLTVSNVFLALWFILLTTPFVFAAAPTSRRFLDAEKSSCESADEVAN